MFETTLVIVLVISLVVLLLAALLVHASRRPDSFRVARSIAINAAPDVIYPLISDFRNWQLWSPFDKLDRNLKRTYEGAPFGVGAIYTYSGDKKVGAGRMEIVEADVPRRVLAKLDFTVPIVAHNMAEFTLEPKDGSTVVTWAVSGPQAFAGKLMGVFFSMDGLIGGQFEDGLANLKAHVESQQTNP